MRQKRGQVTVFVIIGIVAVLAIFFFLFARDLLIEQITKTTNVEQRLRLTLDEIKEKITTCVTKESTTALHTLGDGGGYFTPVRTTNYYGKQFTILCTPIQGQKYCVQQLLSKEDLQNRLAIRLHETLGTCINLNPYRNKDYTLTTGTLALTTTLFPNTLLVNVTYPITLTKDAHTATRDSYTTLLTTPLGSILDAVHTIISEEATTGYFNPLAYSYLTRSTYDVTKYTITPYRIYLVKQYGNPYQFQFAVEGAPRA